MKPSTWLVVIAVLALGVGWFARERQTTGPAPALAGGPALHQLQAENKRLQQQLVQLQQRLTDMEAQFKALRFTPADDAAALAEAERLQQELSGKIEGRTLRADSGYAELYAASRAPDNSELSESLWQTGQAAGLSERLFSAQCKGNLCELQYQDSGRGDSVPGQIVRQLGRDSTIHIEPDSDGKKRAYIQFD